MFHKMPFNKAVREDAFYSAVMKNDFHAFFEKHNAFGYDTKGLELIWDCL